MKTIFQKLQYKNQHPILILNQPDEFNRHLNCLENINIDYEITAINYGFVLAFVLDEPQIKESIQKLSPVLTKDAILWFAYPKKTAKKYKTAISRDCGWQPLGELGFEAVSLIAIDEDWSAMRFRNIHLIKSFKRNPVRALTKEGKNNNHN